MTSSLSSHERTEQQDGIHSFNGGRLARASLPQTAPAGHRTFNMPDPTMTLDEFLAAPRSEVMRVAPATMVYAASGTRRQATLAGIDADSDAYAMWSHVQALNAVQLLFDHGVRHVFTLLAGPGQFNEVGAYRARLLDWIDWGIASREALAEFRQRNWRVRLLCDEGIPQLDRAQRALAATTGAVTVWFQVIPDAEAPWRWMFQAIERYHPHSRAELVTALYGEKVPLVSLYLAFGKPTIAPELLPPLLTGDVQCYWSQRPGYALSEDELRRILYDYAFLRPTWQADKTGRAEAALANADVWQNGSILGLGQRLGPFWYPQPFAAPQPAGDPCLQAPCTEENWQERVWSSAP